MRAGLAASAASGPGLLEAMLRLRGYGFVCSSPQIPLEL